MSTEICKHIEHLIRNTKDFKMKSVIHFCQRFGFHCGENKQISECFYNFVDCLQTLRCVESNTREIHFEIQRTFLPREICRQKICKHIKLYILALAHHTFDYGSLELIRKHPKHLSVLFILQVFLLIQPPVSTLESLAFRALDKKVLRDLPQCFANSLTVDTPLIRNCQLVISIEQVLQTKNVRTLAFVICFDALKQKIRISHSSYTHKQKHCILLQTQRLDRTFLYQLQACYKKICKEFKYIGQAAFHFPLVGVKFSSKNGCSRDFDYDRNKELISDLKRMQHLTLHHRYSGEHNFVSWNEKCGQLDACLCFLQQSFRIKKRF